MSGSNWFLVDRCKEMPAHSEELRYKVWREYFFELHVFVGCPVTHAACFFFSSPSLSILHVVLYVVLI